MPRAPWMSDDRRDPWPERGREARWARDDRDDFGQADYSTDFAYDPDRRRGYRVAEDAAARRNDLGQTAYPEDHYDAERRRAFRRPDERDPDYVRRMDDGDYRRERDHDDERRSWGERARGFFGNGPARREDDRRRDGPSDRVLWAVIVERLEDERGLDLRDVEVLVEDAEVTLNGTVRRKEDKRRIEDLADIRGVRNVQNNLRLRERRGWF